METINGVAHTTNYTYDGENRLIKTTYNELSGGIDMAELVEYDDFGRLSGTEITQDNRTHISSWTQYASGKTANTTTTRLTDLGFYSDAGYTVGGQYAYDNNGNITTYATRIEYEYGSDPDIDALTRMGYSYYHYDTANQLVREDNEWLGKTFVWTYDNAGNITSRKEYSYISHTAEVTGTPTATYTYTYGDSTWGELLTAYNGVARTYDEIGNLLTDGTWTYTWQNGRELASMTDGTTTWNYTYDANGMRTQRSNGTTTYNYVYNGSQLVQMTVGNDTLYFTYGMLGPTTVTWNGTTYYYAVNAQGDVTGIFDEYGNLVVTYNWDNAWGYNPIPEGSLASTIGTLNPLRYRGYVYDTETGYYYLQSRYYDPELGRFINADGFIATGQGFIGNNMFAYCRNNPVKRKDATGTADISYNAGDDTPWDDLIPQNLGRGGGSGGGGFSVSFKATLQSALNGLNMAMGQKDTSHVERHHIFTNKNKNYTYKYEAIAERYNFSLDSPENIISLSGHRGRHTKAYNDFMLFSMKLLNATADGCGDTFMVGMDILRQLLEDYPSLPYARY